MNSEPLICPMTVFKILLLLLVVIGAAFVYRADQRQKEQLSKMRAEMGLPSDGKASDDDAILNALTKAAESESGKK